MFSTSLRGASGAAQAASLVDAEHTAARRAHLIAARKAEAAASEAPLLERLHQLGAVEAGGRWLSPGIGATLPLGAITALAERADVNRIELAAPGTPAVLFWTGADIKANTALNLGAYHDNGFTGKAFQDNPGGRKMRIAILDLEGFNTEHFGFLDSPGGASRIAATFQCSSSSCSTGAGSITGEHGTLCAGVAAGSIREHQISGFTAQEELERTGAAEEPDIYLFKITNQASMGAAIDTAADLDIDVISDSTTFGGTPCDGIVSGGIDVAAWNAQLTGTVVLNAAGNETTSGTTCNMKTPGEALSIFTVGAAADSSSSWSTRSVSNTSNQGGADATINGVLRTGAISLVSALAPRCVLYSFSESVNDGIVTRTTGCGTSISTPQIAGAGVLVKDWFMDNGYTTIGTEGRLLAVLLAMTDRADSATTFRTSGFNQKWGGGRFQARMFGSELGSPWGWETWSGVLSNGQVSNHPFLGTGAEPSGIGQFKAYGLFFEDDYAGVANLNLHIKGSNCSGSDLASDIGYDVKMMAQLGSSASGQQLCVQRSGASVPSGETRLLHQVAYYSGSTSMR